MTKKTLPVKFAVAAGRATNSGDILILPQEALKHQCSIYGEVVCDHVYLPLKIAVNQNFFYTATQHEKGETIECETGIGEIYKNGSDYYLKREQAFTYGDSQRTTGSKPGSFIEFDPTKPLTIRSHVPESYIQTLCVSHSVLCTTEPYNPSPVELGENAVLGRYKGNIQSMDGNDLRRIITDKNIVSALVENTGPMTFRTSKMEVIGEQSQLTINNIYIKPAERPEKATGGFLRYDENGYFEGYDGTKWRKIAWVKE